MKEHFGIDIKNQYSKLISDIPAPEWPNMGIALCHFDLTAKENNLNIVFEQNDPKLETDAEYIASYRLV